MSTWNNLNGKQNDHVCPYLGFEKSYSYGLFGNHWHQGGFYCKKHGNKFIPEDSVANLCYDTQNTQDVFETCEVFKQSRNPFSN